MIGPALILWLHFAPMLPRTFYVAPIGGLGNLECQKKSPCSLRWIFRKQRKVRAGDVVMFNPGIYRLGQ